MSQAECGLHRLSSETSARSRDTRESEVPHADNMYCALQIPQGIQESVWTKLAKSEGTRWAIAERNARGEVIGTSYRSATGSKTFAPGGKRGLIIDWPLDSYAGTSINDPIWVCEGASDTAAMLSLGFSAVGTPMAGYCGKMLAELLADRHVVIIADRDAAGEKGAGKLASELHGSAVSIRIIKPPNEAKDARDAVVEGATNESFLELAKKALAFTLPTSPSSGAPAIVRLADVQAESIDWLWPWRIPLGRLTLIAGDPGLGKSFLTLDIAARVSRGATWPDAENDSSLPGGVVLLNAEDAIADTIRPRLDAAGANVNNIIAIDAVHLDSNGGYQDQREFDLSRDIQALEKAILSVPSCKLVVIDPITAYLGNVDSHKNADVRRILSPLSAVAAKHGVAIIAVTHLNKSAGGPAIYRAMGSLAFTAAARVVFSVSKDKDNPSRRLFLPIKSNIARDTTGLAYTLEVSGDGKCPKIAWESGQVDTTADEALARDGDGQRRRGARREDAERWLLELLSQGPRFERDIKQAARSANISEATLRRAKEKLDVESLKPSFGSSWQWSLPSDDPSQGAHHAHEPLKDAQLPRVERLRLEPLENQGVLPKVLTGSD